MVDINQMSLVTINKKIWEEKKKYFENIDFYSRKIKRIAKKFLGDDVKVILFGSIVKGNWGPNSDIDVLIVSDKLSSNWIKNRWLRTKIKSSIDPFSPFQIHLARREDYENWYKKFIKEDYKEI